MESDPNQDQPERTRAGLLSDLDRARRWATPDQPDTTPERKEQ